MDRDKQGEKRSARRMKYWMDTALTRQKRDAAEQHIPKWLTELTFEERLEGQLGREKLQRKRDDRDAEWRDAAPL
jgi:hypothetical protein